MKKSVIRITCFLVILTMILWYANKIFKFKYGDGIYSMTKFYELEDNTVDVLFLGSSHAFESFNTGTLWDEYGMSTYVLGGSVQPMWNTYYYLKEALKTQTPKLIVLEGYMTSYTSEFSDDSRIIKNTFGMRWTKDKVDAIKISTPESRYNEFLMEYPQYHMRYSELSREDFFVNQGNPFFENWKGFGCNMITTAFEAPDVSDVTERQPLYEKSEEYYRKTIELAIAHNIPIMVVVTPYAGITAEVQAMYNTASDIATEYGVQFINYNLIYEQIGIDFATDAADTDHLNYRGNVKLSKDVGRLIQEKYGVPDHRGDNDYQTWQDNADYVRTMIENQQLTEIYDVSAYIDKIRNPNYRIVISLDGNCSFADGFAEQFLLENVDNGVSGIWYRNNEDCSVWSVSGAEGEKYWRMDSHDLCLRRSFDESTQTYTNHIIMDNAEYKIMGNGLNILVYDTVTQSIVDIAGVDVGNPCSLIRQ